MKSNISQSILCLSLILISIAAGFLIASCSSGREVQLINIPSSIIKISDQYIVSRTGKDFFGKYITLDSAKARKIDSEYFMVYRFKMPEKYYVDNEIRFTVDSLGKVLTNREIVGIPDCAGGTSNCKFSVTKEDAVQIAESNGLPKGIKDWQAGFEWDAKYNQYVWKILSTEKETKVGDRIKGNGQQIIIDPNTGNVIAKNEWKIN